MRFLGEYGYDPAPGHDLRDLTQARDVFFVGTKYVRAKTLKTPPSPLVDGFTLIDGRQPNDTPKCACPGRQVGASC